MLRHLVLPLLWSKQISGGRTQPRETRSAMGHTKSSMSDYWVSTAGSSIEFYSRAGEKMGLGYDIFRELSDGNPLWIAQATTLKEAEDKLETLALTLPAKYFIRDATTATIVARVGVNPSEEINS